MNASPAEVEAIDPGHSLAPLVDGQVGVCEVAGGPLQAAILHREGGPAGDQGLAGSDDCMPMAASLMSTKSPTRSDQEQSQHTAVLGGYFPT